MRWTLLERSDSKVLLAWGRHHLVLFREGQEITVLLCAPDWTLTPHGIVEGTAGIPLFPRALHPPTAAPRTSSPPRSSAPAPSPAARTSTSSGPPSPTIPVPQSAHARAEAAARLSAALADGPDGLSLEQIVEALTP